MSKCYVIAEAGVNHNGSERLAIQMIDWASASVADAVRFQTFKAKELASIYTNITDYQKNNTNEKNQFSMLEKLEISKGLHIKLFDKCNDLNIEFLSTPFDIDSAKFLIDLGMKKIKIPSGEITNLPFIEKLSEFNIPMILSTGMSSLEEVKDVVKTIQKIRKINKFTDSLSQVLTILHCTSNYPAKYQDVNLKAMHTLSSEFKVPVGYSDHTKGIKVASLAVAMGAKVIEKHFTLDKNMDGPDHQASLDPKELFKMIEEIRETEECLGSGVKLPRSSEIPIRDLVRRSVALAKDKNIGETLELGDLKILRPGDGIPPVDLQKVAGKIIIKDLKKGCILRWSDLSK